jgi:peptidyl-prolyl cis-trans isomerase D
VRSLRRAGSSPLPHRRGLPILPASLKLSGSFGGKRRKIMLEAMRRGASSLPVKILLVVLVVSFAVWGVGDMVGGGRGEPVVATVGGSEIRLGAVQNAFRDRIQQLEAQLGTSIDREQAARMGLLEQALDDVVARRLLDLGAADLGMRVSDDMLRRQIFENPIFHGPTGFDRLRFQNILLASGLSEEGYLAALRQDALRSALIDAIAGSVAAPEILARTLYRHRNERREGRMLVVLTAAVEGVPEPSDDDLAAYLESRADRFTTPEYRALTLISLEPADLHDEIEIDQAALQAEYESRRGAYRVPEQRMIEQALAPDGDTAEAAFQLLRDGADLAAVEAALGDQGVMGDRLGLVAARDLPQELAGAAFGLATAGVAPPVESGFGWHVMRVVEIVPESVPPLAELEAELRRDLLEAEAQNRLPALANALDDELAAGVDIEDAAAALGLTALRVEEVDREGRGPDGAPVDSMPSWPRLIETAFQTPVRETSLVLDSPEGGYFVLRVDDVITPRLRGIEEARAELVAGWQAERRDELARAEAERLLRLSRMAAQFEALAEAGRVELRSIAPIARTASGFAQGLTPDAIRLLFTTAAGDIAGETARVRDGHAVIVTDLVHPADPEADPEGIARLRDQLATEMRADLLDQFEAALRRSYPVEIDARALGTLLM